MKYWCYGAGKIGRDFLKKRGKEVEVAGYIDRCADSIKYIKEIPVYTYDEFKAHFSKEEDRIIITVFLDQYIDDFLRMLGEDNLIDYVEGIYKGDRVQKIDMIWQNPGTAQYGEDMALRYLIGRVLPSRGVYVDVGAYHPIRYSNTFFLYQNGWRGINIDANIDSIKLFEAFRKEDRNINSGVSDRAENDMVYHMFEEGGYNTFDPSLAEDRKSKGKSKYLGSRSVPVRSLNDILSDESVGKIDYLNIDIEGFDEKAVEGFDFDKYKPTCVSIESYSSTVEEYLQSNIYRIFSKKGYSLFAYYSPTAIHVLTSSK